MNSELEPVAAEPGGLVRQWREPNWRRRLGGKLTEGFFAVSSFLSRQLPIAHPRLHKVEHLRNVVWAAGHKLKLDVWRPRERSGLRPVVLYLHGGGFRILSKESHWIFGLGYARRGFVTFVPDYRLAPANPFPSAVEDACAALLWVREHAEEYGGDPNRIIIAGESAGANLATGVAIATCWRREEPHARAVFESGVRPLAVKAACGILQVTRPERFQGKTHPFVYERIVEVSDAYLRGVRHGPTVLDLADPLVFLENAPPPDRPLPPFFVPVGLSDPLTDDTRRLAVALAKLGTECDARYYPGEHHAFHAFVFRSNARLCWADGFAFLDRHVR